MRKVFKWILSIFKALYRVLDKLIITPISRLIYKISDKLKGNNKVDRLLNRQNFLLYLSLFLAIVVFLLIDSKVITLVETEAEVLTNIPVKVQYNEEAYVIEGIPKTVDMVLTGRKSVIYLAKQLGEYEVVLDLADYESREEPYKVDLRHTKAIESLTYKLNPSYVTITIKDKISTLRTIDWDLLNENKLNSKLSVEKVELSKTEVVVKGSEEALNNIAIVKALINLNNSKLSEAGEHTIDGVPLVAYDTNGNILNNVQIVPKTVSATLTLDTYSATVPIKVMTTGSLVTGKAIASILINNSASYSINIYGEQSEISKITSVPVTINIQDQGAKGAKTYPVSIIKPSGVRHVSEDSATIIVTFGDEKQKTVEVDEFTNENIATNLNANIIGNDKVSVQVKGVQSVIDKVTKENIKAYIDLSSYTTAGTYDVPVEIENTDPKLSFVVNSTLKVRITNK